MFNAQAVEIRYSLNYDQVNLILKGLSKLPFEEVETFYNAFRGHAVETIRAAELVGQEAPVVAVTQGGEG